LEEIHGYLEISDGTASSVVSFPNLTLVAASLYLYDSGSYDFPLLETVGASFEISNNTTSMILDGDILFPSLSSVPENVFISYNSGFTSIEGFSNLTNIGESLEIYENQNITNISGFEGLNVLDMLIIGNNQNLLDISGFTYLESLNYVELYDNPGLVSSTGISEVQSIFSSDIYDNDQLLDPGCDFFSLDSILPDSNVYLFASLFDNDFASCDIDGDGFNLNDGDCDDQDASLELLDTDGDAWTTCDGDCNDGDLTIYPTNTDVWYDGIDSDCDGENDYDQDGDGDNSDLHGGTDCDDLDPVLQGLDLDGDLLTTCDGDDIELVASCLDYLAAGSTTDGMYTLLFLGGSTLDVYCDMTTQGGGWTLFATTTSDKCAEDLPYGPDVPLSTSGAAYLSTAFQDETHSEFLQDFRADGVATSFSIVYDFGNAKTVSDRFIDAGNSGEGVSWNVETVSNTYSYSGTWWYSSGADTSGKWSSSDVDSFSDDDGSWGATNGTVDGDGGGDLSSGWGHENQDGGDSNCSNYYENGSSSSSSNIINLMYFR
jgi:hypothetical protein